MNAHTWVGDSGRHGYDASAAFVVVPFLFATLAFIASEGTGPLFDALVMIGVVGLILGLVECHVLLLFLWPRVFVPPHLRNQRGWVAQACTTGERGRAAQEVCALSGNGWRR